MAHYIIHDDAATILPYTRTFLKVQSSLLLRIRQVYGPAFFPQASRSSARMKVPFFNKQEDGRNKSPPLTDLSDASIDQEKRRSSSVDESRVPWVTWRSLVLGAFVSIGGIVFGYDTGQISGFLEMRNFKQRYGQLENGKRTFGNVRSGLIVSMVCDEALFAGVHS